MLYTSYAEFIIQTKGMIFIHYSAYLFMLCLAVCSDWPYWLAVSFLRLCIKNAKIKKLLQIIKLFTFLFPSSMAIGNNIFPNILIPWFELVYPSTISQRHLVTMLTKAPFIK